MDRLYLDCDCDSLEHTVRFTSEPDIDCIILDFHLIKATFWKRVMYAVRYVFGYEKYGAFDETVLGADKAEELQKFLEQAQKESRNG